MDNASLLIEGAQSGRCGPTERSRHMALSLAVLGDNGAYIIPCRATKRIVPFINRGLAFFDSCPVTDEPFLRNLLKFEMVH